jgi:hypothetical protein
LDNKRVQQGRDILGVKERIKNSTKLKINSLKIKLNLMMIKKNSLGSEDIE